MPTAASRPAPQFFASLALPDGRIIPVEGIVLIGRKPRSERIVSGVLPTLVQVPSPQGVVSSTHLEVRHEGSAVLVTDVGSSNGTALIIQGQPPRRLRAGEPTVVIPGTLLDLGDGVVLRVQPFERGELR
nr:FHA domain-containing protein [Lysinibacter cavernae]